MCSRFTKQVHETANEKKHLPASSVFVATAYRCEHNADPLVYSGTVEATAQVGPGNLECFFFCFIIFRFILFYFISDLSPGTSEFSHYSQEQINVLRAQNNLYCCNNTYIHGAA